MVYKIPLRLTGLLTDEQIQYGSGVDESKVESDSGRPAIRPRF
jgi:hypothetical protein